ncbi:unnamed protein product [Durusdinium trenchii]|uniref:Uncharacterized protein n=1 Tax=Durusdinium trenchii TaxID=1381693 RepID=A0ABP0NGX9_9DINO
MRRTSSSSSLGQTRRKVSLTLRTDPEGFSRGWEVHPVARTGPRYSIGKAGLVSDGDRRTWVDKVVKDKVWVPGPGAHATERSFVNPDENEFDAKKCIEDLRPKYSFGKAIWEPALSHDEVKPQRNSFRHPKFDPWFNPGPGAHTQFTVFSRKKEAAKS